MSRIPFLFLFPAFLSVVLSGCGGSSDDEPEPAPVPTPEPVVVYDLNGVFGDMPEAVWMKGDTVSLLSVMSFTRNKYVLANGEGTINGGFNLFKDEMKLEENKERLSVLPLYAMTNLDAHLYGVAATDDDKINVQLSIPPTYGLSEVAAAEGGFRMPVPFWGEVSTDENDKMSVAFRGLSALLRIPVSALPNDTKAVMLTTHPSVNPHPNERNKPFTPATLNGVLLEGGNAEPISGTFSAILEEGAHLAYNENFFVVDSLRIEIGNYGNLSQYKNLYVPILPATYKSLHVVALTAKDSMPYEWEGSLLKTFTGTTFRVNTIVDF